MAPVFLAGPLGEAEVLERIVGHVPAGEAARLGGHGLVAAIEGLFAAPVQETGATAPGTLLRDLGEEDRARLRYFNMAAGLTPGSRPVTVGEGLVDALIFCADPQAAGDALPWQPNEGRRDLRLAVVDEVMRQHGRSPPDEVAQRMAMLASRAASTRNAASSDRPPGPGGALTAADIDCLKRQRPFDGFFAVERLELTHRRFDGRQSARIVRECFVMADAATVLPYDPQRDRVLVIEQFRTGTYVRGDPWPWSLEPIAGRIDAGETAADTARREAVEEAGLTLGALHRIGGYYPSPGGLCEYLISYIGLADLPDGVAGQGGLEDEAEDIRGHLLSFADLDALALSGGLRNGPLLVSALWLARHRPALRAAAG